MENGFAFLLTDGVIQRQELCSTAEGNTYEADDSLRFLVQSGCVNVQQENSRQILRWIPD